MYQRLVTPSAAFPVQLSCRGVCQELFEGAALRPSQFYK